MIVVAIAFVLFWAGLTWWTLAVADKQGLSKAINVKGHFARLWGKMTLRFWIACAVLLLIARASAPESFGADAIGGLAILAFVGWLGLTAKCDNLVRKRREELRRAGNDSKYKEARIRALTAEIERVKAE